MRKSILRFGALALMSLMSIGSWAQTFEVNGCTYTLKDLVPASETEAMHYTATLNKVAGNTTVWNGTEPGPGLVNGWEGEYDDGVAGTPNVPFIVTEVGNQGANLSSPFANSGIASVKIPAKVTEFAKNALAVMGMNVIGVDFRVAAKIGESAFRGVTFTGNDCVFEFNCNPEASAFYDAKFPDNTTVWLKNDAVVLNSSVFGFGDVNGDLTLATVKLSGSVGVEEVGSSAFKNRKGLTIFGYYNNNHTYYLPASLSKVDANAFENTGITNFDFADNDLNGDAMPRITKIGDYAFKSCAWMTNQVFANVCGTFADITYGKGSFQDCNFTGTLDLRGSKVEVSRFDGNNNPNNYSDKLGVPENAFAENKIAEVLLDDDFEVIQKGAFQANPGLEIPKVLPSGLQRIDANAFSTKLDFAVVPVFVDDENPGNVNVLVQDTLYLPVNLKMVESNAFAYRYIKNVYAAPSVTGTNIPTLGSHNTTAEGTPASLKIDATYVPASAQFKISGKNGNNKQSMKAWYAAFGWQNAKYPTVLTNALLNGVYTYVDNSVEYQVAYNFTITDIDGCIPATLKSFTDAEPVIYGYVGLDNTSALTGADNKKSQLKYGDYQYPIVLTVGNTDDFAGTYKSDDNDAEPISAITFSPNASNNQGIANLIAEDLVTAAYTTVPANICLGNDKIKGESVTISEGITTIGENAFQGTRYLTEITLPTTLATVRPNAFADIEGGKKSGLASIELPSALQNIKAGAFAANSLKEVKVKYRNAANNGIPNLANDAFVLDAAISTEATPIYKANLTVLTGDNKTYKRKDYSPILRDDKWVNFFDRRAKVETANDATLRTGQDQSDLAPIYTENVEVADGEFVKAYVLNDAADITQVKISNVTVGAKVPVKYSRKFNTANVLQCWYVPFDFKYEAGNGYKFYYIYNTTQTSEGADAVTTIGLREVEIDEEAGYATIKANVPYVIKVAAANTYDFIADALEETPVTDGSIKVTDVKNEYTFTGTYQRKGGNPAYPWYGISGGQFRPYDNSNLGVNAFRFYMTALHQENPYGLVKFAVLDDEDATSIEDVKSNTLSAPMFDLMGRQITSPAKGQVYIQNGVKKLAK